MPLGMPMVHNEMRARPATFAGAVWDRFVVMWNVPTHPGSAWSRDAARRHHAEPGRRDLVRSGDTRWHVRIYVRKNQDGDHPLSSGASA